MTREREQQLIDAYLSRNGATKCAPQQAWQTSARTGAEERRFARWRNRSPYRRAPSPTGTAQKP